jgi:hypothetical protein
MVPPPSGDGRANPAVSPDIWLSAVGLYMTANGATTDKREAVPTQAPTTQWHGDGQGQAVPRIDRLYSGDGQAARSGPKPPGATRADTWKLVMLVVLFVVWISTASALLFLYMDRYLFPG